MPIDFPSNRDSTNTLEYQKRISHEGQSLPGDTRYAPRETFQLNYAEQKEEKTKETRSEFTAGNTRQRRGVVAAVLARGKIGRWGGVVGGSGNVVESSSSGIEKK